MGGMLGNKRQDRGKKKFRGPEIVGGGLFGEMPKKGWKNFLAVPKSGGNSFGGHNNFLGGEFFRNNLKKKIPGGDSLENCPNKFRGDFLGGSYTGGRVWGECWEIKDKIGEKKIQVARNLGGGNFWGNAKKGVDKLFGGSKKWWEFFGGHNNFWGENFSGKILKKKIPGGDSLENCQKKI